MAPVARPSSPPGQNTAKSSALRADLLSGAGLEAPLEMAKALGAVTLALAVACSHGRPTRSAAANPLPDGPPRSGAPHAFGATPPPPDLSNHPLLAVAERVIGPKHPVLARHEGQRPIVHLSGFYAARPPGTVRLERSLFELAVFEDGTLAFQGYECGWGAAPTTAQLSASEVAALRRLVDEKCFQLPGSSSYCTHSGLVQIRCSSISGTVDLSNMCEGDEKTRAWKWFAGDVRRLLRIDDRPLDDGVCAPADIMIGGSEIERTISPWVIVNRRYGPQRQ